VLPLAHGQDLSREKKKEMMGWFWCWTRKEVEGSFQKITLIIF